MDRQHRDLFQKLDRLTEAIARQEAPSGIEARLAELCQHTIAHFQMEESLMRLHGYPGRIVHANRHHALILEVRALQHSQANGRPVGLEVAEDLAGWFLEHIPSEDRPCAKHVQAALAQVAKPQRRGRCAPVGTGLTSEQPPRLTGGRGRVKEVG
jgi:hemerythrin